MRRELEDSQIKAKAEVDAVQAREDDRRKRAQDREADMREKVRNNMQHYSHVWSLCAWCGLRDWCCRARESCESLLAA